MSFFVSKSLIGKVDENCLIPGEELKKIENEFVLGLGESVCNIKDIHFLEDQLGRSVAKINFECNMHTFENLFVQKNIKSWIRLKNSKFSVSNLTIENIFKKDGDNYIVSLIACYSTEGVDNV